MELLAWFWDLVVRLDVHLADFVQAHGVWVYGLLFLIVFCETGLVVTPFLPGDSLLFVAGAVAAAGDMNIAAVMATLIGAALCGDNVNYWVGRWIGPRVFHFERSRWFNPAHLARAHAFYERHGGKTIILARFVPIVRTYVPFVAGVGTMPYLRYLSFCVLGAFIWVVSLCLAGFWFGNQPIVKNNLTAVILLIVAISVSPGFFAWLRSRRQARVSQPLAAPKLSTRLKIAIFAVFITAGVAALFLGNPIERFRMNEQQACDEKCKKQNKFPRLVPALPPSSVGQGKYDGPWTCECY